MSTAQTIATIDLGTNSVHLLVAKQSPQQPLLILHDEPRIVRLGEGLRQTGQISQAALERTVNALKDYQAIAQQHQCDQIYLTATAAMREASNQAEAISFLKEQTGLDVELVDKSLEGQLSYESVTQGYAPSNQTMVVDIGGGSVDFGWGQNKHFDDSLSISIGTVKLLEGPLAQDNWDQARQEIDHAFTPLAQFPACDTYIGTAGTFTQLASLDLRLKNYNPETIDNHTLTPTSIAGWLDTLEGLSLDEIKALPGVSQLRADVLVAGTLLVEGLFRAFPADAFHVRDRGIRFGRMFRALSDIQFPLRFKQQPYKT
jgi:exopolyphosphatase/guanosine-5'-triphosphate,3'-diphosphate pyrophosphatase